MCPRNYVYCQSLFSFLFVFVLELYHSGCIMFVLERDGVGATSTVTRCLHCLQFCLTFYCVRRKPKQARVCMLCFTMVRTVIRSRIIFDIFVSEVQSLVASSNNDVSGRLPRVSRCGYHPPPPPPYFYTPEHVYI